MVRGMDGKHKEDSTLSKKSKLNLSRTYDLGHNSQTAEFYTGSKNIYGIVEFPESESSSGERGVNFKLDWDFREDGVFRVAVYRKKDPPPDDRVIRAGDCYLELVSSLSIDPQTGEVLPYYEAQQRADQRRVTGKV
jgi:hypothetical protein